MRRVSTSNDASNSPQENSIFEGNPEDDSVYREENGDKMAVSGNKSTVVEKVIIQEKPSKTINKIMVFYSDNTFDTFVLEIKDNSGISSHSRIFAHKQINVYEKVHFRYEGRRKPASS